MMEETSSMRNFCKFWGS